MKGPMEDMHCIRLIQAGHTNCFGELYDIYAKKIFAFIYHKMGDKQATEDIVSETFLTAFTKIDRFDTHRGTSFAGWLYTVSVHAMQDYCKQKRSVPFSWIEEKGEKYDILQEMQNRDKLEEVLLYLQTLDASTKDIFIMRVWDDIPYADIALIVGKSSDTCKTIFSRTLAKVVRKISLPTFLLFLYCLDKA